MSGDIVLLYAITVFVASVIPGPSMLLALTHGMKFGVKRTIASAMGNVAVTIVQAIVSIVGLGAVLIASGLAFEAIKFAGAAYLIYLGIRILFSVHIPVQLPPCSAKFPGHSNLSYHRMNHHVYRTVYVGTGSIKESTRPSSLSFISFQLLQ